MLLSFSYHETSFLFSYARVVSLRRIILSFIIYLPDGFYSLTSHHCEVLWNLNYSFLATTSVAGYTRIFFFSKMLCCSSAKHNFSALMILLTIAWHEWSLVFLTQINSWKYTRRQLQSSLNLLCATVASNQAKWSLACFYEESLINRWVTLRWTQRTFAVFSKVTKLFVLTEYHIFLLRSGFPCIVNYFW